MALPATDTFTAANGTDLVVYSSNWTYNNDIANFEIQGNALTCLLGAENIAHWNADTFNDDQYSKGTFTVLGAGAYMGVSVRCASGATKTGYLAFADSADACYLQKYVGSSLTAITNSSAASLNDVIQIEASGDQISVKRNGNSWIAAQTDSSIASGYAGIAGAISGDTRLDNWEGGNLGGITKSLSDTGAGIDNPQLAAALNLIESALGGDFIDLSATLSTRDIGTGSDEVVVSIAIIGSTVWGHVTGVEETNIRTFATNWTGTGQAEGSGDDEKLRLCSGEFMISEIVETGVIEVTLLQNNYASGDTVLLQYRHGATEAACVSASWNNYTAPFTSLGYVQVRVEATV